MHVMTLHLQVKFDGELRLALPREMAGRGVVVTIQAEPVTEAWPEQFFAKFAGCMSELPHVEPQGRYEEREAL